MKGFGKALARTPFAVTTKIGMSKRSTDAEFDDYERHFTDMEKAAEKLIKDTKAFSEAVSSLFTSGAGFGAHFAVIFQPIQGESELIGRHPDADHSVRNVGKYEAAMEEMKGLIAPELELIDSRIGGPAKELQSVMRLIRKSITKREHKLTDYDRFNNSLTKLRDKKDKSLNDEKNLFKLEQDFEIATHEYDYINNALKQDLPRFMMLSTQFIDPLFNSFFYMQLNIFYLILEKMNSFADEGKYDISNVPGAQIAQEYEERRSDAWSVIENLGIVKRIVSVSRLVQTSRIQSQSGLGRQGTSSSSSSTSNLKVQAPPSRSVSSGSSYKKAPPPPSNPPQVAPPPYSPSFNAGASAAASKRPPPPPPPLKPKPKPGPQIKYVVALYDFVAQTDGDLSFNTGDRIELVEKTQSSEDWWTGRLNGVQGVFPGNYVQET
ncbi:BAR-domain-containing protein [Phlegmacium glaucopus]|nr:BAR-domain-containing protein [Phlegmacium glaucopus]